MITFRTNMINIPNKEMNDFFRQFFATGFVLMIIIGLIILKFLESLGIVKIMI